MNAAPLDAAAPTSALAKYLARYAEPEARIADEIDAEYAEVLVVPVCRESPDVLDSLASLEVHAGRVLAVVVVNERTDASPETRSANAAFIDAVRRRSVRELSQGLLARGSGTDVLVFDRASPGRTLPAREGVGRARKIGADVALALWARGASTSPWIHMTDADAILGSARFRLARETTSRWPDAVALTLPFAHRTNPELEDAVHHYESWLRYLVLGLAWAGSPYAFHSIGGAIAVRADAYAIVRGVPNRLAGEDFYLLDKLAKIGTIAQPEGTPVLLQGRESDRVPFGTGPAVRSLAEALRSGDEPRHLAPECFLALRRWIEALDRFAEHRAIDRFLCEAGAPDFVREVGACDALIRLARRSPSAGSVRRHLHTWFDGLRTIRFLHSARDRGAGTKPWREAFAKAPFLAAMSRTETERNAGPRGALERLRDLDRGPRLAGLGVSGEWSRA